VTACIAPASYLALARRGGANVEELAAGRNFFDAPEVLPQVLRRPNVEVHMTSHQFSYPKVSPVVAAPSAHGSGAQRPAPLPATR
jgi:hypothetical protein